MKKEDFSRNDSRQIYNMHEYIKVLHWPNKKAWYLCKRHMGIKFQIENISLVYFSRKDYAWALLNCIEL